MELNATRAAEAPHFYAGSGYDKAGFDSGFMFGQDNIFQILLIFSLDSYSECSGLYKVPSASGQKSLDYEKIAFAATTRVSRHSNHNGAKVTRKEDDGDVEST